MIARNTTRDNILAEECMSGDTFLKRFMGLMGKRSLAAGYGLLITPCNSIHMFFMKFSIDVVFLDKNGVVVHTVEHLKPWKVSKVVWDAHSALELPAGTVTITATAVGDRISFI